jgi:hypothetical protein
MVSLSVVEVVEDGGGEGECGPAGDDCGEDDRDLLHAVGWRRKGGHPAVTDRAKMWTAMRRAKAAAGATITTMKTQAAKLGYDSPQVQDW